MSELRPRLKARHRLIGLLRQRCPRCCRGKVFLRRLTMNEYCSVCGLRFGREPGYFVGAMDASWMLGVPILFGLTLLITLTTGISGTCSLAAAMPLYLLCVPLIYRYSRIIWMYWDRAIDPD
jgi:uncharacterized protein (DUF983 family)